MYLWVNACDVAWFLVARTLLPDWNRTREKCRLLSCCQIMASIEWKQIWSKHFYDFILRNSLSDCLKLIWGHTGHRDILNIGTYRQYILSARFLNDNPRVISVTNCDNWRVICSFDSIHIFVRCTSNRMNKMRSIIYWMESINSSHQWQ